MGSALFLSQHPRRPVMVGVVLTFSGLILLSFEGPLAELNLSSGDGWVAVGEVGWALYFVLLARYATTLNILLFLFSSLHIAIAAVLSSAGWLMLENFTIPVSSGALWLGILSSGFLSSAWAPVSTPGYHR